MASNCRCFLTAAVSALAVACSSSKPGTVATSSLTVTATPSSAVADGASTIAIHVDGSVSPPIRVAANRGTFGNGATAVTFDATPFDVTLHSCDAHVSSACAGPALVQVVDASLATGAAQVVFTNPPGVGDTSGGGSGSGGSGTDGGSGGTTDGGTATYQVSVIASSTRIPADGSATTVITAGVTGNGAAAAGRTIGFTQAGTAATLSAAAGQTNASGLATIVLTSDPSGGVATVTATDTASGASSSVAVTMPKLGQVTLLSQQYSVQGVRSSGYQETNQVTFQLLDTSGSPYPAGLAVAFAHQSLAGSFVGSSASCSGAPVVCTAAGSTNASGQVTVPLTSGQMAGVVSVKATATAGQLTATGAAGNIAVVGAKVSGAHVTVDCTPKNVPALSKTDCLNSQYSGPGSVITCSASFSDRFNNALGVATMATFATEAGTAGPPATTVAYDPSKVPSAQTSLGTAMSFVDVTGGKLPVDVTPFAGEFSFQYPDVCGNNTHNPRDGLVTVIVMAHGEEGFVDLNGNGQYDAGEPFIDMGEPYLDLNDNGQWDPGEPFWDLNGNNRYDGPNGKWDADTVVWAETRVLFTGAPAVASAGGNQELSRLYSAGSPPSPTATPSFAVLGPAGPATSQSFGVLFVDGNFNALAPTASYSIATQDSGVVGAGFTQAPSTADTLGISFTQQYCDSPSNPTACSSTCTTSPCYVVTNVGGCNLPSRTSCSGFAYGTAGQATVTGLCSSQQSDTVTATAIVNGTAASVAVTGTCSSCASGFSSCGGTCVNTSTDPKNCGGCGLTCSGTQTCQSGVCQGPGGGASPYAVSAAAGSTRIPADGAATTVITATATNSGAPAVGRSLSFAVNAGSNALLRALSDPPSTPGQSSITLTTNANGQALATFISDPAGGTTIVTVTDVSSGQSTIVSIVMPQLGQVNVFAQQYQVQGVRFSGYQEVNQLTFQLLDTAGQPYPAGLDVSFSHQSLSGSYIGSVASCGGTPVICTAGSTTNGSGQVSILLTSGQLAGVVSVRATATAGGLSASGIASNLAIIGAKASGAHITVDCSPRNVPALMDDDCTNSHYAGPGSTVTCTATFADRFNNVLGISTQATFASEAGAAGPPTWTPQYDPTKVPSAQTNLGIATDFVNVTGGKLPVDVPPFQGEFSFQYLDACGNLTHNPRDGLVTIIVMANGEEGFVDLNGNGQYDAGEPFIDLGEPYLDLNDNGQWDQGEPFWDLNQNGTYDGPNGKWDSNTVIWAETRILYTGLPMIGTSTVGLQEVQDFSRFFVTGQFPPTATPTDGFTVLGSTTGPSYQSFGVVFMDGNFNAMTPTATYSAGTFGGLVTPQYTTTPPPVQNLGMTFTQLYCDKAPPNTPTLCSNTCTTAPCYVVTNVGNCDVPGRTSCNGFSYGSRANATITGACTKPGSDTVKAIATINGIATNVYITGTCTP